MHKWQDLVLSAGGLVFALALLPSIRGKDKPALSTSLMTGTVLGIFAVVYASLKLWFATTTAALSAILWIILAGQKHMVGKNHKEDKE